MLSDSRLDNLREVSYGNHLASQEVKSDNKRREIDAKHEL
jgi:hypothetical protein